MAKVATTDGIPTISPENTAPAPFQRGEGFGPDAFGAASAEGMQRLGQSIGKVGDIWSQVQTQDVLNTAMTHAAQVGDNYRKLQGGDALRDRAPFEKQLDDVFVSARKRLSLADQHAQFDREAAAAKMRIRGMINNHADQEGRAFTLATNNATIANGLATISTDPHNDESFAQGLDLMMKGTVRNLQLAGTHESPEVMTAAGRKVAVDATQARIKSLLTSPKYDDQLKAKEILETNRELLAESPNYEVFANHVETVVDTQTARRKADEYLAVMPQPGMGPNANSIGNVKTVAAAAAGTQEFEQPATPADGVILAANNLRGGYRNLNLRQIGAKWAPPSENDTGAWVTNVSRASGLSPDVVPNLDDPSTLKKLLHGIAVAEKSPTDRQLFTDPVMDAGIDAALSGKAPKLLKAQILLDETAALAKVDADFKDQPRMARLVSQQVKEQYGLARTAQQATALARQDATERSLRQIGDAIYANPMQDIDPILTQHPELSQANVEHLRDLRTKLLQAKLNGAPGDYGEGYSEVQQSILGSGPTRIVNVEQLGPLLTAGKINVAGYAAGAKLIEELKKPGAEGLKEQTKKFYENAEKAVTLEFDMPGGGKFVTQERREKWNAALPVLNQAIAVGRAAGKTDQDMMNPDSKDSIWPVLKPFMPTPAEKLRADIDRDDAAARNGAAAKIDLDTLDTLEKAQAAYRDNKISKDDARRLADKHGWFVKGPQVPAGGVQ